MTSIRLFLTLTIISIITLVNFLSSLRGYRESMREADTLFDEQLLEYALLLSATLPESTKRETSLTVADPSINPQLDNSPGFQSTLVFQILDSDRNLLLNFNTAAKSAITSLNPGYSDVNFDDYRWHAYTFRDRHNDRWIITAQRYDIRYALAERVVLESIVPIVLGIPVAGLIVWFLVGAGLKPVSRLARELQQKKASDLSPVILDTTPRELQPLQESTNELLGRLKASFEREKRFAADAAHELRTPISVLKVQLHNLLDELENQPESAQQLKTGIDRMGHLVEQILDLNKTSPDLSMSQFDQVDIYALCKEVVSDSFDQFLQRNQTLELLGDQAIVNGDRFALGTLLKNLLSNASKYTHEGGHITVKVIGSQKDVILEVVDNGPGIPDTERLRALERFYRTSGDRHRNEQPGCGLGLAIVDHIVELHSASLELSEPVTGSGLRVTITFRRSQQAA